MKLVKKIRDLHIQSVENGYTVQVGCKTFVFNNTCDLLQALLDYMRLGEAYEDQIFDKRCLEESQKLHGWDATRNQVHLYSPRGTRNERIRPEETGKTTEPRGNEEGIRVEQNETSESPSKTPPPHRRSIL